MSERADSDLTSDHGTTFAGMLAASRPRLMSMAAAYAAQSDRHDLIQDTMLRAWQKRSTYDPDRGEVITWLLAIMADQARHRLRRGVPKLDERGPRFDDLPVEVSMDVRRAVNSLPRRQREVTILYYYLDLSVSTISVILGCSDGTVKSNLHDARQRLLPGLKDSLNYG